MTNRRGILYATGALLLSGPPALWITSSLPVTPRGIVVAPVARTDGAAVTPAKSKSTAKTTPAIDPKIAEMTELAERDPLAVVRRGRAWYEQNVHTYRCTLIKQELLGDKLSDVQEVELRFREQPRAIFMIWKTNADSARRALYLDTPQYVDKKGQKLARVEPNGAVARLFTKDIFLPVDGSDAKKTSRHAITDAGFHATFSLFEKFCGAAAERGVLDLKYAGTGTVDSRPTFVLVRQLPYEGANGTFPDAKLVLHLDQEWLLPVAAYSYADKDEKELLGSYVFTKIELNPTFDDNTFAF
jgi:hypothetical protein